MPEKTPLYDTRHYPLLKLFAILCIVVNHSIRYGWPPFKILTNDFQVPLLFFASGFVFSFCLYDLQKYRSMGELAAKKIRRLLLPYAGVLVLWFLPLFFISGDVRYAGRNPLTILVCEYPFGVNADALWFLMALFTTYIVAYVGREAFRYAKIPASGRICALIVLGLVAVHQAAQLFPTQFHLDRSALYAVHFFVGYLLNIGKMTISERLEGRSLLPWLLAGVGIIYILDGLSGFLAGDDTSGLPQAGLFLLQLLELVKQFGLIAIFVLCARKLVRDCPGFCNSRLVRYLDSRSFDIYLYHWPVLLILLDCLTIQDPLQKALLAALGCFVTALLVGEVVRYGKRRFLGTRSSER
ncbi:MAG: acyltransferase [Desulfovibrio sp.]|nr:acyltransferase [Desulfovibrio sp.]